MIIHYSKALNAYNIKNRRKCKNGSDGKKEAAFKPVQKRKDVCITGKQGLKAQS